MLPVLLASMEEREIFSEISRMDQFFCCGIAAILHHEYLQPGSDFQIGVDERRYWENLTDDVPGNRIGNGG